jgi:hypothetical protein
MPSGAYIVLEYLVVSFMIKEIGFSAETLICFALYG